MPQAAPPPPAPDLEALARQLGGLDVPVEAPVDPEALAAKLGASEAAPAAPGRTSAPATAGSMAWSFGAGFGEMLNPIPILQAIYEDNQSLLFKALGPGGTIVKGVAMAQANEAKKGYDAYKAGNYGEALVRTANALIPIAGPMIGQLHDATDSGDPNKIARVIGNIVGVAAAPKVLGKAAQYSPFAPRNPTVLGLAEYAERNQIPISAGTATGNLFVRGGEYIADRTLAGSVVASKAEEATRAGLSRKADQLLQQA